MNADYFTLARLTMTPLKAEIQIELGFSDENPCLHYRCSLINTETGEIPYLFNRPHYLDLDRVMIQCVAELTDKTPF